MALLLITRERSSSCKEKNSFRMTGLLITMIMLTHASRTYTTWRLNEIHDRQGQGDWENKNIIVDHWMFVSVQMCTYRYVALIATYVESTTYVRIRIVIFHIEPLTQKGSRSWKVPAHPYYCCYHWWGYAPCVFYNFRMESTEKCDAVISHFNGKFIKTPAGVPGKTCI